MHTVGQLSALAGVSVRTLHHYDRIGLLSPGERSEAGYRLYGRGDLERLREILGWRALGFPLAEIAALLDDPGHDRRQALRRQRELVAADLERLGSLAAALDRALATDPDQEETMFDGYPSPDPHADEARERWGETDAFRESARRTAAYSAEDWREIRAETSAIERDFAALLAAGEPPGGAGAQAVAARHRTQISERFFPCSAEMHRCMAEMYVADARFAAYYDGIAPGLAAYVHDAILAASGQAV